MARIDDLLADTELHHGATGDGTVTFLPEPAARASASTRSSRSTTTSSSRPTRSTAACRRSSPTGRRSVVETDDGSEVWVYDGAGAPQRRLQRRRRPARRASTASSRPASTRCAGARGTSTPASPTWTSTASTPRCASRRSCPASPASACSCRTNDPELALATRAGVERLAPRGVGAAPYPDRIIPCQIPYLLDPEVGGRGDPPQRRARASRRSRSPRRRTSSACRRSTPATGTRSCAACAETGTVVSLHIGSSGTSPSTSDDAPPDVVGVLFFGYAMFAAVDWLYSKIPVRFPDIKICLSEGGIGWVAGLIDRLDHMLSYHEMYGTWSGIELDARPRCCSATSGSARSTTRRRSRCATASASTTSSSRPTTRTATRRGPTPRQVIERRDRPGFPTDDIRRITWQNASELFRHPVPAELQRRDAVGATSSRSSARELDRGHDASDVRPTCRRGGDHAASTLARVRRPGGSDVGHRGGVSSPRLRWRRRPGRRADSPTAPTCTR